MSDKRMFSNSIVGSDAFLDLSKGAQILYFQLGMRADDRGYVNNPKTIIRISGVSIKALNELIEKKFVLDRGNNLLLIKHWRINNNLPPIDRFKESKYVEDLQTIYFDENMGYTEKNTSKKVLKEDVKINEKF